MAALAHYKTKSQISQVMIVSCIWNTLNMYMAPEFQQFKFQFYKSKSFNGSVPISSLFLSHLSRFDERGIEVWVNFRIIQCFSYSKLLYNSRYCLIPFCKGHMLYQFMNIFRIVYSVKALFAVQLSILFCLKMWNDIYFFPNPSVVVWLWKSTFQIFLVDK